MSIKGDMGAPIFTCRGYEHQDGKDKVPKCDPVGNSYSLAWVLEGLASWTTNPCGYNFPGVYTKIDDYVDWIYSYIYPATSTSTTIRSSVTSTNINTTMPTSSAQSTSSTTSFPETTTQEPTTTSITPETKTYPNITEATTSEQPTTQEPVTTSITP